MGVAPRAPDDGFRRGLPQRDVGDPAQQRIERPAPHHHCGERRREGDHERQGHAAHHAVEHRHDHLGRDRVQDRLLRPEPGHDVAHVARLEIARRQVEQVGEQVGPRLHLERHAQQDQHPAAHGRHGRLQQQQQAEAQRQRQQQVVVRRDDGVVQDPDQEQRAGHREHLHRQRHAQQAGERALEADHWPHELAHADARRRGGGLEGRGGHEFERHPGEVPRELGQGEAADAHRRVMDDGAPAVDAFEDDEVVQVPVQDAGHAQHRQLVQVQAQGSRGQADPVGDADYVLERGALGRQPELVLPHSRCRYGAAMTSFRLLAGRGGAAARTRRDRTWSA